MARKLKDPFYSSFRLQKRIKTSKPKLPSVKNLFRQTLAILRNNKRFFLVYTILYGILSFIFIQSSAGSINLSEAQQVVSESVGGRFPSSLLLYSGLITNSIKINSQMAAWYQFVLILVFSLAVIYGLRHMYGEEARRVTVKESLYKGMTPLVPIVLVLGVVALQLLPLSLGSSVYATVIGSGLAVTAVERVFWLIFLLLLALLTIYLISSSVFALFIVTLPNMTPMRALRAARELVRFRRLEVIRKIILLPVVLLIVLGLLVVPFIAFLPVVAQAVFLVASALVLPVALTYLYNLYRKML